nr:hypothetical protein Iba_chr05dCG7540 [Ipomoea batatas]
MSLQNRAHTGRFHGKLSNLDVVSKQLCGFPIDCGECEASRKPHVAAIQREEEGFRKWYGQRLMFLNLLCKSKSAVGGIISRYELAHEQKPRLLNYWAAQCSLF